jgi:hypothetical protein
VAAVKAIGSSTMAAVKNQLATLVTQWLLSRRTNLQHWELTKNRFQNSWVCAFGNAKLLV